MEKTEKPQEDKEKDTSLVQKSDDKETAPVEVVDVEEVSEPLVKLSISEGVFEDKHYERIGFALGRGKNASSRYSDYMDKEVKNYDEGRTQISEYYDLQSESLKEQILTREEQIVELKERYDDFASKLPQHKIDNADLENRKNDSKSLLRDTSVEIGLRKREIISNRIDTLFDELDKLNDRYLKMIDDKHKASKSSYDKNKDAIKFRINLFNQIQNYYNTTYDKLSKKIEILHANGIGEYTSKVLVSIGFAMALVAGWYYSIYSLNQNLNSDSVLFFVINTIFNFSEVFLDVTDSKVISSIILFGGFLVVLFLITFLIYLSELALNKIGDNRENDLNQNSNKILLNLKNSDQFQYTASINTNSTFKTWVSILPYLIVSILVFVILSVGRTISGPKDIQSLDASLSGHFAGFTLAIGVGVIAYFYLAKIIEPRIDKKDNKSIGLWYNIELLIIIALFISGIIFGIIYIGDTTSKGIDNYVLVKFGISSLITALVLGYGWYYTSILSEHRRTEIRLSEISTAIRDNSRPFPSKFVGPEIHIYSKKYLILLNQIMNLMSLRNLSIQSLYTKKKERSNKKENNRETKTGSESVFTKFLRLFTSQAESKKDKDKKKEYNITLTEEDQILFPDLENKLIHLKSEYHSAEDNYYSHSQMIEQVEQHSHEYQKELTDQIRRKRQSIRSLKYLLSEKIKDRYNSMEALKKNHQKNLSKLEYGYKIGQWWENENINPDNA